MDKEQTEKNRTFVAGIILGVYIGAGIVLLTLILIN